MCLSISSDSSGTIEVIIINRGTITVSEMLMHHVLIIWTWTFIQGHTYLNHGNNECVIISETDQAIPIKFAVTIVQLKVDMTIASPMT